MHVSNAAGAELIKIYEGEEIFTALQYCLNHVSKKKREKKKLQFHFVEPVLQG